ncbi:MAG: hypothetical protein AB7N76_10830 [Planctomycetota bacterium]
MDPRRKVLYSLFAAGLALLAWAHLRAVPALRAAKELEKELGGAQPAASAPDLRAARREVDRLQAEEARLRAELPAAPTPGAPTTAAFGPELEVALARLSQGAGLTVERVQCQSPLPTAQAAPPGSAPRTSAPRAGALGTLAPTGAQRPSLAATLRGDFFGLQRFVQGLSALPGAVVVERLAVAVDPRPGQGALRVELQVGP